jgi:hypothetical protein
MTTRTQIAYLAVGVVLVLGLSSLFNPTFTARLLGFAIVAPRGLSEVRATYGALFVTLAALVLWALPLRPRTALLLRALGLLWAGAAAGRLASMAIDGLPTLGNLVALAVAAAIAFALVWASYETPPSPEEARALREAAAARRRLAGARRRLSRRSPEDAAAPAAPRASGGTGRGAAVEPRQDAEGRGGA